MFHAMILELARLRVVEIERRKDERVRRELIEVVHASLDLDHVVQEARADAVVLVVRQHGQREQIRDDLRRAGEVLGVKAEHREAAPPTLAILLDPREHAGLLEPRRQDPGVVAQVAIRLRTRRNDPGMVAGFGATDQAGARPRFDCHRESLARVSAAFGGIATRDRTGWAGGSRCGLALERHALPAASC